MFAISYRGEVNEDFIYETYEEAQRAIEKEVLDACREDALYGCYSKRREASYWQAFKVVRIAE